MARLQVCIVILHYLEGGGGRGFQIHFDLPWSGIRV